MTTTLSVPTYAIRVEYFSGGDVFAAETLLVDQPASGEIEAAATIAAEASPYFNASVPELSYAMRITPFDPDDPEPPPAGARARPVCTQCGSDQLVRDASARWDMDAQDWTMSGLYDCTTCNICGGESDDLARWVPADHVVPLDRYTRDLAAALDAEDIAQDYDFIQFCLGHFRETPIEEAQVAWNGRARTAT
ncbi:hypothetical protein [Sphingopyxis sp. P1IMeth2]|uniref:hypothetical protein n=1 Tax=Sphingopyxis sp. P1IMeth2 TaxID=1892848 RepID=UPI0016464A70|nr:hypothetical protein [Sphingopyxis sp. P1IMeth2]